MNANQRLVFSNKGIFYCCEAPVIHLNAKSASLRCDCCLKGNQRKFRRTGAMCSRFANYSSGEVLHKSMLPFMITFFFLFRPSIFGDKKIDVSVLVNSLRGSMDSLFHLEFESLHVASRLRILD